MQHIYTVCNAWQLNSIMSIFALYRTWTFTHQFTKKILEDPQTLYRSFCPRCPLGAVSPSHRPPWSRRCANTK